MGAAAQAYIEARKQPDPRDAKLSPEERAALYTLQQEAEDAGATLATGGRGGIAPSRVLNVMRRDGFRCKRCGREHALSLHHKGGVVLSKWLSKKGHSMEPNNLVTICASCHDALHNKAREAGVDSTQVTPEGDKG